MTSMGMIKAQLQQILNRQSISPTPQKCHIEIPNGTTYTVPAGITKLSGYVLGPGGSGYSGTGGGAGGGSGFVEPFTMSVTPGQVLAPLSSDTGFQITGTGKFVRFMEKVGSNYVAITNGTTNQVWVSTNGGTAWTNVTTLTTGQEIGNFFFVRGNTIAFGTGEVHGSAGLIIWSTDAGVTWNRNSLPSGNPASYTYLGFDGTKDVFAAIASSIQISKDFGTTWTATSITSGAGYYANTDGNGTLFTSQSGAGQHCYTTTDFGVTWRDVTTGPATGYGVQDNGFIMRISSTTWIASAGGTWWKTTDNGATFTKINTGSYYNTANTGNTPHWRNGNLIFLNASYNGSTNSNVFYISTDGGTTFTQYTYASWGIPNLTSPGYGPTAYANIGSYIVVLLADGTSGQKMLVAITPTGGALKLAGVPGATGIPSYPNTASKFAGGAIPSVFGDGVYESPTDGGAIFSVNASTSSPTIALVKSDLSVASVNLFSQASKGNTDFAFMTNYTGTTGTNPAKLMRGLPGTVFAGMTVAQGGDASGSASSGSDLAPGLGGAEGGVYCPNGTNAHKAPPQTSPYGITCGGSGQSKAPTYLGEGGSAGNSGAAGGVIIEWAA